MKIVSANTGTKRDTDAVSTWGPWDFCKNPCGEETEMTTRSLTVSTIHQKRGHRLGEFQEVLATAQKACVCPNCTEDVYIANSLQRPVSLSPLQREKKSRNNNNNQRVCAACRARVAESRLRQMFPPSNRDEINPTRLRWRLSEAPCCRPARPCCATPSRWLSLARRRDWLASSLRWL